jgi:hypothetical protein
VTREFGVEVMGLEPTTSTLRTCPDGEMEPSAEQQICANSQLEGQFRLFDPDRL